MTDYTEFYNRLRGRQQSIRESIRALEREAQLYSDLERQAEKAVEVVNTVLLATQESVRRFVEDVVTLGLSTVYGEAYAFQLLYDIQRSRAAATPSIRKGELVCSPRDEVGGGVVDVAGFGLRMALWALRSPRPAPVFLLDEPGKNISNDKQPLFGRMLREVQELLGVQVLMVSHNEAQIETADVAYCVTQDAGVSTVTAQSAQEER